ncbi:MULTISPECIES: bifunctional phosphopantothenoylcysteine decarboxylase/phosphopantothenate--cysteine ligase CoaBC [Synechocystis]|uniref:Coenzyme A biosynthesis bifunctional protein CoaBC n=1 Tax=Synechocystis salina LEGE 00031 TaxID=1828736 RepID=A0ABR9VTT0_9SYNC|nr:MULTISPECIES: bifunctional phosphopantothenoylcysteine decarboxylase/phosphopantothenate--cysteine ligase CoaBC [Synechocystis]MBE9194456.1 bifunctional phosphopantothenoylcysteine decarboxylase/phosphopantothenate--cysteine ligase CoaBC [Synechocystis sp. LEGE 06083]MBE9241448.1 bifunctional phosphopantothenoylcysteine decarboxylase/phosphopantothenate--cysteine ligase CoaBC [Synechocystis salina LEGE 00041]MBE9254757.1 bifunctional phosphopantothenoylcysteine decarboxylase/phosphopantothena
MVKGKRILIGVGGGIAAYKICEVVSQLFQQGAEVKVILTAGGEKFVTPLTFTTLARHPAYCDADFWQPIHHRPLHIDLGEWADIFLIAPLTAHTLAKLSHGFADDLLSNTVLASRCPILLAPAMNTDMWEQEAVQRNLQQLLTDRRYHLLAPNGGLLACDRRGMGRLAEPTQIINRLQALLFTQGQEDLRGKRILITAGGTQEYLDAVRFIGNPSTGKMGLTLAQSAGDRGATVTLIHGPIGDLSIPMGVTSVAVVNAEQMQQALMTQAPLADWIVMAAAVADVKPAQTVTGKMAKQDLPASLPLAPVPDLIAQVGKQKQPHQLLVGFAAQTGDIITPAQEKLQRKNLDVIVANPIDQPQAGFGSDSNQAVIIDRNGSQTAIAPCTKLAMAHQIWQYLLERVGS